MVFLGIDIGTSGCKATIISENGKKILSSSAEYSLCHPKQGYAELYATEVLKATFRVLEEISRGHTLSDLAAVSVTSFGEALVPVDKDYEPLCKAIIYIDVRGQEEVEQLRQGLGAKEIYNISGAPLHSMYSLPKLMWIKNNRPDIYEKTHKFCSFADFILLKLGAMPHMDYSLAARTMAFDVVKKDWSSKILGSSGIDSALFGKAVPSGTTVGELEAKLAMRFNCPKNVRLVAGGHDQPCAALGAGITAEGRAVDGMGSTECITPAFSRPMINDIMEKSNLVCVPHTIGGLYVTYAFNYTAGSLYKWYKGILGDSVSGHNKYKALGDEMIKTPSNLLVLPHFAGAATPYMDNDSRGAIIGMTIQTSRAELTRGILEGISYEMMINLECLEQAGFVVEELRAVGGLSKDEGIVQMKADMTGKVFSTLEVEEAGTLGVAILGGVAAGLYSGPIEASNALVKVKKEFYPDAERDKQYKELFEKYKRVYSAVKEVLA